MGDDLKRQSNPSTFLAILKNKESDHFELKIRSKMVQKVHHFSFLERFPFSLSEAMDKQHKYLPGLIVFRSFSVTLSANPDLGDLLNLPGEFPVNKEAGIRNPGRFILHHWDSSSSQP
jgi:hypothetical protein